MSVANFARSVLRRAGVELVSYAPRNFLHLRRVELLQQGGISVLIDVGADDGTWAQQARSAGFRGRIESFEPRADAYAVLARRASADHSWNAHRLGLSDTRGQATINVSSHGQSSSLLELGLEAELAPDHRYVATEAVDLAPLDELSIPVVGRSAYLKIDVQGHELAVLQGAAETLASCAAVELELSFVPLYVGQPLAHDLMAHLAGVGFALRSFETSWRDRSTGDLLLANGLFTPAG